MDASEEDTTIGDAGSGASDPPAAVPTVGRPGSRRFLALVALLTVVLAALVAVGVVLGLEEYRARQAASRDQEAVATAREVATRLGSLGAEQLGPNLEGLLAVSTGPFRQQLAASTDLLGRVASAARFTSEGTVSAAGVEHSDGQIATVLVVSSSRVTNVEAPDGNVRRYRLAVTLQWDGSRWLAQSVEQVG